MRPAEKPTAKTTFIYFAILIALIFNLLAGTIPLKTSAIMFKACHLPRKGPIYSYKIAFLIAILIYYYSLN